MTDPTNETPPGEQREQREQQSIAASDVGSADTVLGLGGVAAGAVAGSVSQSTSPNAEAAPPQAGAAAPEGSTPAPTGQVPAETIRTNTPGVSDTPVDKPNTPTQERPRAVAAIGAPVLHPDVHTNLNAIEQLALYWGGETGNKIRNHLGRIRELIQ